MSRVVIDVDETLDVETLHRVWQIPDAPPVLPPPSPNTAQLTVLRNGRSDFQDRQVYLFVDEQPWGKVKYGHALTGDIAPGRHTIRAFNTLFSHTLEVDARPGEHVRLRCTNGMPTAGWLMMIFLHVTALCVKLERE